MTTQATAAIEDRLALFIREATPVRELVVSISRADERRLARHIEVLNRETPEDPLDPESDVDLGITLMGCALGGLEAAEAEDGVWADIDGRAQPLPRRVRAPRRARLRYAMRAARQVWRAT